MGSALEDTKRVYGRLTIGKNARTARNGGGKGSMRVDLAIRRFGRLCAFVITLVMAFGEREGCGFEQL